VTTLSAPAEPRATPFLWDFTRRGPVFALFSLAIFAAIYTALVLLGLQLHEAAERLTVLWPAAGFLFVALWLAPPRLWIVLLAIQLSVEILVGVFGALHFTVTTYFPFAFANSVDAMVGATVARSLIPTPREPKLRNVLIFMAAVAVGSAASATLGAFGVVHQFGGRDYLREWQIWWAGNWLGSLCVAPILMGWAIRLRARELSVPSAPAGEMILIAVAMLGMTAWVFSAHPNGVTTILDMPFVLLAFAVVAAFRLPPRWSATLTAATAVLVAYFVTQQHGPFASDPNPFVRIGAAQLYLVTLVGVSFLLTVALLERRNAYMLLRTSDERYRNFIEHSSEAVWRIELKQPMAPTLNVADQVGWLREHAYVAESNLTYLRLNRQIGVPETEDHQFRVDVPWAATFIEHLGAASHQNYEMDGLQFTVTLNGTHLTYITAFRGVIEQGMLVRVWGVARDVSELVELNERLRQKQDRLKLYARELVGAEERARRATAVDLHDGIGQQLVGLSMTLNALMGRSPPEIRLLLSEATTTVREVQAIAQRVIADLSPPGLYELGLEPALKWLSVYMRSKDNLEVQLHVDVEEASINLDLRVLVFKVIRELLRNVVRHSGVQRATVTVTRTTTELRAVVEDQGVGFEWQLSLFEPRENGFGLWSIVDRVREAAGEMTVDTGPGRGCRVTLSFPLATSNRQFQAANGLGSRQGQAGSR
jgi:signal transduction histidine kinase